MFMCFCQESDCKKKPLSDNSSIWHVCPKYNFSSFIGQKLILKNSRCPFDWTHFDQWVNKWISWGSKARLEIVASWPLTMWTRSLFPKLFALNPLPWYRVQLWQRFCPFFVAAIVSPRLDAVRGRLIHLGWSMIVSDDQSRARVTSLTPNQILTTAGRANNLRAISKSFYPIRRPPHSKWVLQVCLGLKGLRGWGLLAKVISSALAPWWQPHQTALHKSEPPKK